MNKKSKSKITPFPKASSVREEAQRLKDIEEMESSVVIVEKRIMEMKSQHQEQLKALENQLSLQRRLLNYMKKIK